VLFSTVFGESRQSLWQYTEVIADQPTDFDSLYLFSLWNDGKHCVAAEKWLNGSCQSFILWAF